jgi:hypothetical protein
VLIGFNILVSVEWDAPASYLDELRQGFERASTVLYDATDGQMLFEGVSIYDNYLHWKDADYRFEVAGDSPQVKLRIGQLTEANQARAYFPRYFPQIGSYASDFSGRAIVHEFGHYGLSLHDSYKLGSRKYKEDIACTSVSLKADQLATNASIMFWAQRASEFAMQGVDELWNDTLCKNTEQWRVHGMSDWETIVGKYSNSHKGWTLKTPKDYNGVVAGPTSIPIGSWSSVFVTNSDTGVCSDFTHTAMGRSGGILAHANVMLIKKTGQRISQGVTDQDAKVVIVGAHPGDTIIVQKGNWLFRQTLTSSVSCSPSSQMAAETSGDVTVVLALLESDRVITPSIEGATSEDMTAVLEDAAFNLDLWALPGSSPDAIVLHARASQPLAGPPTLEFVQEGTTTPLAVTLAYNAQTQTYSGEVSLQSDLPQRGVLTASAADTAGQTVDAFAQIALAETSVEDNIEAASADYRVRLYVSANSLPDKARVSIAPTLVAEPPPSGKVIVGGPYLIQAGSGVTLSQSAGLSIAFNPPVGVDPATAKIYRWDVSTDRWVALDSNLLTGRPGSTSGVITGVSTSITDLVSMPCWLRIQPRRRTPYRACQTSPHQ